MDLALIPERNLLECGALPFGDLVRFATREGWRPRPIYQIHKWFARRLGCSFRALLIGAVETPTADFWKAYYGSASLRGLTVLDPFVGGGTSVVEAARLGASAIGVDVDPIACAVTTAELAAASLEGFIDTVHQDKFRARSTLVMSFKKRLQLGLAKVLHISKDEVPFLARVLDVTAPRLRSAASRFGMESCQVERGTPARPRLQQQDTLVASPALTRVSAQNRMS